MEPISALPKPPLAPSRKRVLFAVILAVAAAIAVLVVTDRSDDSPARSEQPASMSEAEQATLEGGLAAHNAGRLEEAEAAYRSLLDSDGGKVFAHYNLGVIAQSQGRVADAISSYREALEINPDYTAALFNLATLLSDSPEGAPESAEIYREILRLEPENARAHMNLGLVLGRLGETADAEAHLSKALSLDAGLAPSPEPAEEPAAPAS